jgi:hypothetical protein
VLGPHRVAEVHEDDHGGWSYWTVVVDVAERFAVPSAANWETAEMTWVGHDRLTELELLPAFREMLRRLGYLPDP